MATLYDSLQGLSEFGFFDLILPFLLIFAVTFAILQKIKLFGDQGQGANLIISIVMGLLFLQNQDLIVKLHTFLPAAAIGLVVIVVFLVFLGTFIGEKQNWTKSATTIGLLIGVGVLIWALTYDPTGYGRTGYGSQTGFADKFFGIWYSIPPELKMLIIGGLIIWAALAIIKGFGRTGEGGITKFIKDLNQGLRGRE